MDLVFSAVVHTYSSCVNLLHRKQNPDDVSGFAVK